MPHGIPTLQLRDYTYDLPSDRIAMYPLPERDASKLLVSQPDGSIDHRVFRELPEILPAGSTLVVNRTRVIHARLRMQKPTGGLVEVFLTRPVAPSADPAVVLASADASTWECLLGGRNIREDMELTHEATGLRATVVQRNGAEAHVTLSWPDQRPLAEVLVHAGDIPLPPYIKRDTDSDDRQRYQTVFAQVEGSVAAPTASLHFTERVLHDLDANDVTRVDVTLHVGLGTFKPVEVEDAAEHDMHRERFGITRQSAAMLAERARSAQAWLTVVGTTALRTVESLCEMVSRPWTLLMLDNGRPSTGRWMTSRVPKPWRQSSAGSMLMTSKRHGVIPALCSRRAAVSPWPMRW